MHFWYPPINSILNSESFNLKKSYTQLYYLNLKIRISINLYGRSNIIRAVSSNANDYKFWSDKFEI